MEICRAQIDLAIVLHAHGQRERSAAFGHAAAETASRFGLIDQQRWVRSVRAVYAFDRGEWHEALAGAEALLAEVEAGSPHYLADLCYTTRAQIRLGRDDVAGALADAEQAIEFARLARDPQELNAMLATCAHVSHASEDIARAAMLADEFVTVRAGMELGTCLESLHVLVWTLSALGRRQELIEALPTIDVPWVRAARAFVERDLHEAADICSEMGAVTEEARDRLWLAEALIRENRRAEAEVELQRALAFSRSSARPATSARPRGSRRHRVGVNALDGTSVTPPTIGCQRGAPISD